MIDNYNYIESTGTIVPDTGDLLTQTQNAFKSIFGIDLIVGQATPQDAIINAITLILSAVVNNNATLANQINPNLAGQIYLWAIGALTGLQPPKGTPTLVPAVTLAGTPLTVIPAGLQVQTAAGDIFESLATVTLPNSGTITTSFQSLASGPVPCNAHALSVGAGGTILNGGVLGLDTVDNSNAGIPGVQALSDAAFRNLRNDTLALQGKALIFAIKSNVSVLPGVQSMSIRENYTKVDATIDGIFLLANSIYACVNGGDSTAIANALLASKSLGANWNGGQEVDVIDPSSGQTYPVKFDRPTGVRIYVKVDASAPVSIGNPADDIRNSLIAYANGEIDGQKGFIVGGNVSSFELAGASINQYPSIQISNLTLSLDGMSYSADPIAIALNEIATLNSSDIDVNLS